MRWFFLLLLALGLSSCPAPLLQCGLSCYHDTEYCCLNGVLTQKQACPGNSANLPSINPVKAPVPTCPAPLLQCGTACYQQTQYCCLNGTLTQIQLCGGSTPTPTPPPSSNCPAPLLQCGPACYNPSQYCCPYGQLVQKQFCSPGTSNGSVPITATGDFIVLNSCSTTLFIEARMGGAGTPLPGQSVTSLPVAPGASLSYVIPDTGASGTRFWAKYGCDARGNNCLIGDQAQYYPNPPGGCPPGGCTVPIDSLFEATWGCKPGSSCASTSPTTYWDTSQVDGWTLPYRVTVSGDTSQCDCNYGHCGTSGVDASHLDLANCPSSEDLSDNGLYAQVNGINLRSVDLRYIVNGQVLGCMSPCKRLNYGPPAGLGLNEGTLPTIYMCCPTPDPSNCLISQGCITPDECRIGPIINTKYVAAVHKGAPGVYSYAYDDGVGLHACPAGVAQYHMEFCPPGAAPYPRSA